MSNAIRYDSLLVAYLATELHAELQGRRIGTSALFAPDRSVTLPLERGRRLSAELHPSRGWIRITPDPDPEEELDALCTGVTALADERILRLDLHETGRFQRGSRSLYLELHTNQWNALLVGPDGRIHSVLRPRRAGTRLLVPGEVYRPPPFVPRLGVEALSRSEAWDRWVEVLGSSRREERGRALIARFACTGSLNARWILGEEGPEWLEGAFQRWWWLRSRPPARPQLIHFPSGWQPYPLHLEGYPSEAAASLLAGMDRVAEASDALRETNLADAAPGFGAAEAFCRERLQSVDRKLARLQSELAASGEADSLREKGDLILARLHRISPGSHDIELEGWSGEGVAIELDPQLTPAENAARYYEAARRRKRAAEQIPGRIAAAEEERERCRSALEALVREELPDWIAAELRRRMESGAPERALASLPYRLFRTSGGLEVRVGRSARENDRLTFHASTPNDIWLHAQAVPGSHVILRWPDAKAAPPARDLMEAAQLAAIFSRARSSNTVAVDWTRRKYVRKPRGAAPGAVLPQQVRTLLVAPDLALLDRLMPRD